MKVVHVSTSDRGGAGIAAVRLHNGLLDDGAESSLLTRVKSDQNIRNHYQLNPEQNIFERILLKTGLKQNKFKQLAQKHLAKRANGYEYFSFPFSAIDIMKHESVKNSDIIHLHWVSDHFLDFESFFKNINKPVVWTLHDMNPFTGGCHHADDSEGFMTNCHLCPQLKGTIDEHFAEKILSLKKEALKNIYKRQLKIIAPSQWILNQSKRSALFSDYDHFQIPNIIASARFPMQDKTECRRALNLPLDKKIILFVANDVDNPRKGIKYLEQAINKFDNTVVVCGVGKNHSMLTFPNYINSGYVNDSSKLSKIYSAADLYVLPSLAENFPNTICESLISGTPVVAFDVGGITELIDDSNGRKARLKDIESLRQCISFVLENPSLFNRDNIHEKALEKFDTPKSIKQHLEIYHSFY